MTKRHKVETGHAPSQRRRDRIVETRHASSLLLCLLLAACSNDMERVAFFAPKEMPAQQLDTVVMLRSESGRKQMTLEAPHIDVYKQPEAKTVCPNGLELRFFDNQGREKAYIRADYGISYDQRDRMELKRNVVIIDRRSGDTSYLADLYWDGSTHRIHSPHPVRSVNGPRLTLGDSFESDEDFEQPLITRQRGTILIEED